jgi:DNA-binding GntR family transcriptional regulator
LATQLDVSHTPIRQALERLVAEGFADRVPYRGITVAEIDEEEVAEVYAFRLLLEPVAVRLAAKNMPDDAVSTLSAQIARAESLVSLDEMNARREINTDFHKTIISSCGRPVLTRILEHVWNRYQSYWILYEGMFRQPEFLERQYKQEIEEHVELMKALQVRDSTGAEELAYNHIQAFLSDYLIGLLGFPAEVVAEAQAGIWPSIGLDVDLG